MIVDIVYKDRMYYFYLKDNDVTYADILDSCQSLLFAHLVSERLKGSPILPQLEDVPTIFNIQKPFISHDDIVNIQGEWNQLKNHVILDLLAYKCAKKRHDIFLPFLCDYHNFRHHLPLQRVVIAAFSLLSMFRTGKSCQYITLYYNACRAKL